MSGFLDPIVQQFEERLAAEVAAAEAPIIRSLLELRYAVDNALIRLGYKGPPRQIVLLPQYFTNLKTGAIMADFQLPVNQSFTEAITLMAPGGTLVPALSTDTFTYTTSDATNFQATFAPYVAPPNATPAQTALVGTPAVTVQWLFDVTPPLTAVSMTISDSAGNTAFTRLYDMAPAVTVPDQIGLDDTDGFYTTIPTPPAPPVASP